ncbi:MAG: DUF86 domain-containing protein [Candidatus Thermoplasmatota archaeon]|nr:DUF86 domain-containing protein [Candidatus Thermoplasmatota archaeon]
MIDKDLMEAKLDIIERDLRFVKENYKGIKPEEVEKDFKGYQALKFSLFEIIEACLDIANHIIAAKRLERIETYSEMFTSLGKNGIISTELAEELSKMARFRNLLVHRYAAVDVERVMEIVNEHLVDVAEYMMEIKKWMG